jgi:hypothetical protein
MIMWFITVCFCVRNLASRKDIRLNSVDWFSVQLTWGKVGSF